MAGGEEAREERFTRHLVAAIVGAASEHGDPAGAPDGSVDAWLTYPDGRTAALETTWATDGSEFQLRKLIKQHGDYLPAPGMWTWTVQVASPSEFPRIVRIAEQVMLTMESYGVGDLWSLPYERVNADADLKWLRDESESLFSAHVGLAGDQKAIWSTRISTTSFGSEADALAEGIAVELKSKNTLRHIRKLLKHDADERHLFVLVSDTGLSEAAHYVLINPEVVPSAEPDLPDGITDLWLHAGFGERLIRWQRGLGWMLLEIPGPPATS